MLGSEVATRRNHLCHCLQLREVRNMLEATCGHQSPGLLLRASAFQRQAVRNDQGV